MKILLEQMVPGALCTSVSEPFEKKHVILIQTELKKA